jgi:hypothetical protein
MSAYSRAPNREAKIELYKQYKNTLFSIETLEEPAIALMVPFLLSSLKSGKTGNIDDSKSTTTAKSTTSNISNLTDKVKNKFKQFFGLKTTDKPTLLTTANVENLDNTVGSDTTLNEGPVLNPQFVAGLTKITDTGSKVGAPYKQPLLEGQKDMSYSAYKSTRNAELKELDPNLTGKERMKQVDLEWNAKKQQEGQSGEGINNFIKNTLSKVKNNIKNVTPKLIDAIIIILKYYIVYEIGRKVGIVQSLIKGAPSFNSILSNRETIFNTALEINDRDLISKIMDKLKNKSVKIYNFVRTILNNIDDKIYDFIRFNLI